ncbi:MAG: hypothetical protein H6641_09955 [Caldilineaceae bacterium]|nr:hypothetical protein [Caldilineaceae bacterium]
MFHFARLKLNIWPISGGLITLFMALAIGISTPAFAQTDIGYQSSFKYPSGIGSNGEVTAEKPESKLWWNDGYWWASMWSNDGNAYHIFRLKWSDQSWEDTGVELDNRSDTKADALWDAGSGKLYVVSHIWTQTGNSASAGDRGELFRCGYSGGVYSLDSGFPVEVNQATTEALVIAKDSTGTLWVTYVENSKVMINYTGGGDDTNWGTPIQLPVGGDSDVDSDDLSSIVSYDGHIGVMWSSQKSGAKMYFAVHKDGDGNTSNDWASVSAYTPSGDDHISLRSLQSDSAGKVFAAVKTSFSSSSNPPKPFMVVLACTAGDCSTANNWSAHTAYMTDEGNPTRPILLLDTSNREVYMFVRVQYDGSSGAIYYKKSSLDNISFESGLGTPFIKFADMTKTNDPTSTKQTVNSSTELVVLASDRGKRYYLHNCISLSGAADCTQGGQPAFSFGSATYSVAENGGGVSVEVRLSSPVATSATIEYATGDGAATAGSDYTAASGTLTFASGETGKTFLVPILDDAPDEADETISLTLQNATGALLGTPATATVTIIDDDPNVQIASAVYSAAEGAGVITADVIMSTAPSQQVTVDCALSGGTATVGDDYVDATGTLTFAPGETQKNVQITIQNDALDEDDETFTLTLNNPTNAQLGTISSAIMTIVDDDPSPTVQFENASYTAAEDAGLMTANVLLSVASSRPITVSYATADGTATAGSDYTAASGTLIFAPGETSRAVQINIGEDALHEADETVMLVLSNPVNATLGSVNPATLTIMDNDAAPAVQLGSSDFVANEASASATISVVLSASAGQTVTVDVTPGGGSATAESDYVGGAITAQFAPGETIQFVTLTLIDDSMDEVDETVQLALSNANGAELGALTSGQLTIVDDDLPPTVQFAQTTFEAGEASGTANVTVTLSTASGKPVSVAYATSDGTAKADADYTAVSGSVNFAPGETSKAISVPILDDLLDEGDETLALTLSNPTNATLGAVTNAVLTITDNDALVRLGNATYSAAEDAGTLAVEVQLNAALDHPVTVHVATGDDTATAGSDYVAINDDVTFAVGETSKQLLIQITDDAADEADERFTIALSDALGAKVTAPAQATITIIDNDAALTAQFSQADYTAVEASGAAPISVTLSQASSAAVTVAYTVSGGSASAGQDFAGSTGVLNFAPGETTKSFTVAITDDAVDEADETVFLSLSNPTGAQLGAPAQATLTIVDDEAAPLVQFESSFLGVPEDGALFTFEVTLSSASDMTITVEYGSTGLSGQDLNGAVSGVLTFAPGQTSQTVTINTTELASDLQTGITVQLLNAINATLGSQSSTTLIFANAPRIYLPLIEQ